MMDNFCYRENRIFREIFGDFQNPGRGIRLPSIFLAKVFLFLPPRNILTGAFFFNIISRYYLPQKKEKEARVGKFIGGSPFPGKCY